MSSELPPELSENDRVCLTQDNLLELARTYSVSVLHGGSAKSARMLASVVLELDSRLSEGVYSPTDWEKGSKT